MTHISYLVLAESQ